MTNVYIYDSDENIFKPQTQKTLEEIGKDHQKSFKKTPKKVSILNKIMLFFARCK